jgi:hypothetical protein
LIDLEETGSRIVGLRRYVCLHLYLLHLAMRAKSKAHGPQVQYLWKNFSGVFGR